MKTAPDGRRPTTARHPINERMMDVVREQNLTQADCVRGTGATSPTVSDWFNKGAVPDAETLGLFCRMTKTNCHWMITGQGPKHAPGTGNTPADEHIAMGARSVIQDVRVLVSDLEHHWSQSATRRDARDAALVRAQLAKERRRLKATRRKVG